MLLVVFFFSYNSVRIGQNLLNKVPVEGSTLVNFANYHLNSQNGNLNGSRKGSIHGSIWTQNDQSGCLINFRDYQRQSDVCRMLKMRSKWF